MPFALAAATAGCSSHVIGEIRYDIPGVSLPSFEYAVLILLSVSYAENCRNQAKNIACIFGKISLLFSFSMKRNTLVSVRYRASLFSNYESADTFISSQYPQNHQNPPTTPTPTRPEPSPSITQSPKPTNAHTYISPNQTVVSLPQRKRPVALGESNLEKSLT